MELIADLAIRNLEITFLPQVCVIVVSHRSQLQGTSRKGWKSGLRLIGGTQLLKKGLLLISCY